LAFLRNPAMGILEDATCAKSISSFRMISGTRYLPNFHYLLGFFRWPIWLCSPRWPWHRCGSWTSA
jgi:hypothetical protein